MEKKTKLTITLALAVLVITLSLGTAISMAPNESGAQTAAPIQQEIAAQIQPEIEEPQFGACCTTSGVFSVLHAAIEDPRAIYDASQAAENVLFTITCTYIEGRYPEDIMAVSIPPHPNVVLRSDNSFTYYGRVTGPITVWAAGSASLAEGWYEITIVEP